MLYQWAAPEPALQESTNIGFVNEGGCIMIVDDNGRDFLKSKHTSGQDGSGIIMPRKHLFYNDADFTFIFLLSALECGI